MKSGTLIETSCGEFYLETTDRGLYSLEFPGKFSRSRWKNFSESQNAANPELLKAGRLLKRYFKGESVSFQSVRIDLSGFTSFEQRVLKNLAKIPAGKIESYGNLARKTKSPKAARAVGMVMSKNRLPVILPCHRVVRAGGKIGNYSGGVHWKKRLLELEGIVV